VELQVLVIEDSLDYAEWLTRFLSAFSADIGREITFTTCQSIADMPKQVPGFFDLVLLDWSVSPPAGIIDLINELRCNRTCILTGNGHPQVAEFAITHRLGLIYKDPVDTAKARLLSYIKGI